jgi:hypothetical protein
VLLTGGTGFVGSKVLEHLLARGDTVTVVSRNPTGRSARERLDHAPWLPELAPYDAIVHLAGESIFGQRWSPVQKGVLRASRIDSTRRIVAALKETVACGVPKVFVCASAIGYFGDRGDEVLAEDAAAGDDFLAGLCVEWEREAQHARTHGARVVNVRIGVVLGEGGGALAQMLLPFKLGLGGRIGNGRQYMSWVHADDLARLILFALDNEALEGPVNANAPAATTNTEFTKALGRALHRPTVLPIPPFALRLRFGEVADVLTTGQRGVPAKAQSAGFEFRFPEIDGALQEILAR